MRLDTDIKNMTASEARRELQRVRNRLRWHRNTEENARCWHNDVKLYGDTLPEAKPAGRMDQPKEVLLRNCGRYIDQQKCSGLNCPISKPRKRKNTPGPTITRVPGSAAREFRWPYRPHPGGIRKNLCSNCRKDMGRHLVVCPHCHYDHRKRSK
jgi:hypothetical protein